MCSRPRPRILLPTHLGERRPTWTSGTRAPPPGIAARGAAQLPRVTRLGGALAWLKRAGWHNGQRSLAEAGRARCKIAGAARGTERVSDPAAPGPKAPGPAITASAGPGRSRSVERLPHGAIYAEPSELGVAVAGAEVDPRPASSLPRRSGRSSLGGRGRSPIAACARCRAGGLLLTRSRSCRQDVLMGAHGGRSSALWSLCRSSRASALASVDIASGTIRRWLGLGRAAARARRRRGRQPSTTGARGTRRGSSDPRRSAAAPGAVPAAQPPVIGLGRRSGAGGVSSSVVDPLRRPVSLGVTPILGWEPPPLTGVTTPGAGLDGQRGGGREGTWAGPPCCTRSPSRRALPRRADLRAWAGWCRRAGGGRWATGRCGGRGLAAALG